MYRALDENYVFGRAIMEIHVGFFFFFPQIRKKKTLNFDIHRSVLHCTKFQEIPGTAWCLQSPRYITPTKQQGFVKKSNSS